MTKMSGTDTEVTWHEGVATSGNSYLIHRFQLTVLSEGTGHRVSLYGSKCGAVSTKSIDADEALLAISRRCKRCFN